MNGQSDVLMSGLPYIGPYNVNSIMNPILAMCMGLGYFFNPYRGQPARPRGRRGDPLPPGRARVPPAAPPVLRRLLRGGPRRVHRPGEIEAQVRAAAYAEDPWYSHLYRTSHAYHGVHPFYMWYWGAHAMDHVGDVILVGWRPRGLPPDGLPARLDAAGRAGDGGGHGRPRPSITHLHYPPLFYAEVE